MPRTRVERFRQQMNAGRVGRVSEHLAAAWLLNTSNVYVATMPDPSNCDLIALFPDGRRASIQVKTAYWSSRQALMANCVGSRGGRYDTIDYLLVVDQSQPQFYLIPTDMINERSHMRLNNYRMYKYEWEQAPVWLRHAVPQQ